MNRSNSTWLKDNTAIYLGFFVTLCNGELLAAATTVTILDNMKATMEIPSGAITYYIDKDGIVWEGMAQYSGKAKKK